MICTADARRECCGNLLSKSQVLGHYKLALEPRSETCAFRLHADEKGVSEESAEQCTAEPEAGAAAENWAPPDIDKSVPVLHGDAPCPLATVLEEASRRVLELSENLEKFSARERIEHREVGKNGKMRSPTSATFNYIAEVRQAETGTTYIEEYRTGLNGAQETFTPLVDTGTAAFALVFHPRHIGEFATTCEGMADAGGRPAWLVRFVQRADRDNEFHAYRVKGGLYRVNVKGRAWVAADNYEVVRMETDLIEPIPAIGLKQEHLVIEYAPVEFQRRDLRLWLPESATLFIDFHGHRYARTHTFSDFQLFSVDTVEKVKEPTLRKEAAGQETSAPGPALGLMPDNPGPHPPVPTNEMPLTKK